MGLGTKIFVLLLCMSFLLSIAPKINSIPGGPPSYGYGTMWNILSGQVTNLNVVLLGIIAASTILGIIGAVLTFPNVYGLYAGASAFFLALFTVPGDMISSTDIPIELRAFFTVIYGFLVLIAVMSFSRGSDF